MMPPIWRAPSIGVLLSAFVLLARVPARAEHPINEQDLKDGLPCHLLLQVAPSGIVQVAQVVQSVDSTSFRRDVPKLRDRQAFDTAWSRPYVFTSQRVV